MKLYKVLENNWWVEEGIVLKRKGFFKEINGIKFYTFESQDGHGDVFYLPLDCLEEIEWKYTKF